MNDLTEKLGALEQELARERGPLNLFALLEREDLADRWDLVVSASWAKEDEPTLRYLAGAVQRHLAPEEVTLLSRIVILEANENPVRAINETYDIEHGRSGIGRTLAFRFAGQAWLHHYFAPRSVRSKSHLLVSR